ncbi:MAG: hypothetical protein KGL39_22190 [Patescibacteria group bacterium]|nr:hypothetical protein [Patescibacteria group bacterium]
MYMPHLTMPGSSIFIFSREPDFNRIANNEVAVVQRCCTIQQQRFLRVAANFGMKLIYDLDDNVWDLPAYNPAAPIIAKYKEGFYACMLEVDAVTVSTPTLAKIVQKVLAKSVNRRTGKKIPVIVAENRILPKLFAPAAQPATSKVRIGWAGSASHVGDLPLVQDAVLQFGNQENVEIEFRGIDLPPNNPVRQLPNYRFKHWVPVAEYPARMPAWRWNIALAPITNHEFNASKSSIKMIEAGYCGIPCLASWVRPYEEFCQHIPELKWLLCSGAAAFKSKLRDLVNDAALRGYYGGLMWRVVEEHYSLDQRRHEGWEEAFDTLRINPVDASEDIQTDMLIEGMDKLRLCPGTGGL